MAGVKRKASCDDPQDGKVPRTRDTDEGGGDEDLPLDLSLGTGYKSEAQVNQNKPLKMSDAEVNMDKIIEYSDEISPGIAIPSVCSKPETSHMSESSKARFDPIPLSSHTDKSSSASVDLVPGTSQVGESSNAKGNLLPGSPQSRSIGDVCPEAAPSEHPKTAVRHTEVQTEASGPQLTSQTTIGMSGGDMKGGTVIGENSGTVIGENSGTVIGENSGTVIGENSGTVILHKDDPFENIRKTSIQLANQNDPKDYVSNYAERSAVRSLKQFGCIFIKGKSGSGKSSLGLRLLTEMQTQTQTPAGRVPLVLTSAAQWDLIPKNHGKYTVLIDDIFGSTNLVQSQLDDWIRCFSAMWPSVESGQIFLVMTSRPEISANCEKRVKRFILMRNILCVDEGAYQLRINEKRKMLKKICGRKLKPFEMEKICQMKTKLGFPQCCVYFVSSKQAQDKGVSFFENPYEYILNEVKTLQECDGLGYLALVMVLMRNGYLPCKDLTDLTSDFIPMCQEYCRNLPQRVTSGDIKHKLESLCGVYLRKLGTTYEFQHQSLYNAVLFSISSDSLSDFIKMCSADMLLEFVRTPTTDKEASDTVVRIEKENYDVLADRITELILIAVQTQDIHLILKHPNLKEDLFIQRLFHSWSEKGTLSHIVNKKVSFSGSFAVLFDVYECRTLPSLMVSNKLFTLVKLMLPECDVDTLKDILPCAIFVGADDIAQSIMDMGVQPDTHCLDELCASGDIHDNLTDRIFKHVLGSQTQVDQDDNKTNSKVDGNYSPQYDQNRLNDLRNLLHRAVKGKNSRLVELLVDEIQQKDKVSKNDFKECLIGLFKDKSQKKSITLRSVAIVTKLLSTGCDVDTDYLVWLATGHSDAQILNVMLEMDVNVWRTYQEYLSGCMASSSCMPTTSLERAVTFGGHTCVKALLQYLSLKKPTKNEAGEERETALVPLINTSDTKYDFLLHESAQKGDDRKLDLLIEAGMSVDRQDSDGNTPLHMAVRSKSLACVRLLASRASVNVANISGKTPVLCITDTVTLLYTSITEGEYWNQFFYTDSYHISSIDIIKELVQMGSEVNHVDNVGNTALHLAVKDNDMESTRFLLPLTHGDLYRETILLVATLHSDIEIVQLLCEHGARVDVIDEDGTTVLHKSAWSNIDVIEKLQYLTENQTGVNTLLHIASKDEGRTALFSAVYTGDEEVVEFLLNKGLDVNHLDIYKFSVLTYACAHHVLFTSIMDVNSEIVKLLLLKGADPCVQDKEGKTALHYAVHRRKSDSIKLLLEKLPDPCVQDKEGKTALHYAAKRGWSKIIKLLLEKGDDPCVQDKQGMTPLHLAVLSSSSDSIKLRLGKVDDPYVQDKKGMTHRYYAPRRDGSESIKLLLEKGADPCVQDKEGQTALHYAAWSGSSESIKLLLETGAGQYVQEKKGRTPLHLAILRGRSENIKLLLGNGAGPYVQDKEGKTALHHAVWSGKSENLKLLLEKGYDSCEKDKEGQTALHHAAWRDSSESIKVLLEKEADPCVQDKKGMTPLHLAAWRGWNNSVKLLLEKGADPYVQDKEGKTALHYAARRDSSDSIKLLLEKGADSFVQDKEGKTALHYAARRGWSEIMKPLLEKGADPGVQDKEDKTALHYAAWSGSSESIKLLLEIGADQYVQEKMGRTPLHLAVLSGSSESIKLLLGNGAGPYVQDKEGKTALHHASWYGNSENLKLLLEKGYDSCEKDKEGKTALHYAAWRGWRDSIKLLLEKGTDPCVQDKEDKTALHYASLRDSRDSIKLLLKKGADPCVQDKEGKTALHHASVSGSSESIRLLLEKGADPLVQDKEGKTPLHHASWSGSSVSIKLLLEKRADPCVQDKLGMTALHHAARRGSSESIKLLLEKGADPCVQDNEGNRALHYAALRDCSDSIKLHPEKR